MKNLAVFFAFFVSVFFNSNAMQSEQSSRDQSGLPVVLYRVEVKPPVEVLQIPSKKIIQLGGIISKSIRIDCKEYNGIKMNAPINIKYDMTKEELGQALCTAFGVSSINFREGIMPTDIYLKMFPFSDIDW